MLAALAALVALGAAASAAAAVSPRDHWVPPGRCCFSLADASSGAAAQLEARTNYLLLGAPKQPEGWFCLDLASPAKVLYGGGENACILDTRAAFQCLDPTPGSTQYALQAGAAGKTLLAVDGGLDYVACPGDDGSERVYGYWKAGEGCRKMQLAAKGLEGQCNGFSA